MQIIHCRDADRRVNPRRNLEILEEEYRGHPNPEPRLLLYLGNEYADTGEVEYVLHFLQRYTQVSQWEEEKYLFFPKVTDADNH